MFAANTTRVGNLDFRLTPNFNQLPDIISAVESIESGEQMPTHFLQLLRQGRSILKNAILSGKRSIYCNRLLE